MKLTAEITYLSDGQLDTARNIVVDNALHFATLLEAYEYLGNGPLYHEIEREINERARRLWQADLDNLLEHKRWDAKR